MIDCNDRPCMHCRDVGKVCLRESPEALAKIDKREMLSAIREYESPTFEDRHRRKQPERLTYTSCASILKEIWSSADWGETYEQRLTLNERFRYETRRQAMLGLPRNSRDGIARRMGLRVAQREVMYTGSTLLGMIQRQLPERGLAE